MKELRPVKETYYLLDDVSEDNLEDDLKRLNEEINKYGLFLEYYKLKMETSLNPILTSSLRSVPTSVSEEHVLHLLYQNDNQQEKELGFALNSHLVIRNNFKNRKTDIVLLSDVDMSIWSKGYYKFDDQYLVPAY